MLYNLKRLTGYALGFVLFYAPVGALFSAACSICFTAAGSHRVFTAFAFVYR